MIEPVRVDISKINEKKIERGIDDVVVGRW